MRWDIAKPFENGGRVPWGAGVAQIAQTWDTGVWYGTVVRRYMASNRTQLMKNIIQDPAQSKYKSNAGAPRIPPGKESEAGKFDKLSVFLP